MPGEPIELARRGLSPRVRGNPICSHRASASRRSIPACAGEPGGLRPSSRKGRVYPRVCGGTVDFSDPLPAVPGLSPRVRGNRGEAAEAPRASGSIPACAGEPQAGRHERVLVGVYPRVCGGTRRESLHPTALVGLSPRVRGNRRRAGHGHPQKRSIPACAGEPRLQESEYRYPAVYPRVCGGTHPPGQGTARDAGLSPRVRGNPGAPRDGGTRHGSIPACAGEPAGREICRTSSKVYPRVCGGTAGASEDQSTTWGLSPRVRGNHAGASAHLPAVGSIPACAGEPELKPAGVVNAEVYPRVCGGTHKAAMDRRELKGLSPRVRGNPGVGCGSSRPSGSIPACAGEPRTG